MRVSEAKAVADFVEHDGRKEGFLVFLFPALGNAKIPANALIEDDVKLVDALFRGATDTASGEAALALGSFADVHAKGLIFLDGVLVEFVFVVAGDIEAEGAALNAVEVGEASFDGFMGVGSFWEVIFAEGEANAPELLREDPVFFAGEGAGGGFGFRKEGA